MMRKGPDGKTIRGPEDATDDATRKVPRRSIRDRLLAQDEPDEAPATHLATGPTTTDEGAAQTEPRRQAPSSADAAPTVYATPHQPGPGRDSAAPTVYATGHQPGPMREPAGREHAVPPPIPQPAAPRDYIPADPPPVPPPIPAAPPAPAPVRDYIPADNQATKIYRPARPATPGGPVPTVMASPAPAAAPVPAPAAAPSGLTGATSHAGRPKSGMPTSEDFTIADPVVGWLVVVEGPGRGASLNIGYGNNRIGRAPTENISLDFGDEQISRENHATVTFDGRHRRYYVLPGQGRNLVYVNDAPVMSPLELTGGEDILLGATKLRFMPFCGKSFDWYQK